MPVSISQFENQSIRQDFNTYDTYVSLGEDCEAGLQFTRIGYPESGFFRFTSSSFESTYRLIDNDFSGVFEKENIVPIPTTRSMVRDAEYDIVFHSDLPSERDVDTLEDRFVAGRKFDEIYSRERSKIRHFIGKWQNQVRSDRETLYLVKLTKGPGRENARRLLELFARKYPGHRYHLLFLQTEDRREPDWGLSGVHPRYFPRFAPHSNAHDADIGAWDRIFAEFPLRTAADAG